MAITTIFTDGFESGDFSHTENGVSWFDHTASVTIISGFSAAGSSGNCARFFWGDGISPGSAELRFDLGDDYPEVEISWDQYFPDGTETPTRGPRVERTVNGNNKLVRVFGGENFAELAPRFGSETFAPSGDGDELCNLEADQGSGIGGIEGSDFLDFLGDARRGVWFNVRFRFKAETGAGAADGEAHLYINDVEVSSATGLTTFNGLGSSGALMGAGYIWGSQNGQYVNANTFTYIDNVVIAVETSSSGGVVGDGVQGQGVVGFGVVGPLGVSTS